MSQVEIAEPSQIYTTAAIAQLGERQTEDLKVPGSIPGLGTFLWTFGFYSWRCARGRRASWELGLLCQAEVVQASKQM